MKRLVATLSQTLFALPLLAVPAMADVGASFLPDLTFPAPVTRPAEQPDLSTRGAAVCIPTQATPCP